MADYRQITTLSELAAQLEAAYRDPRTRVSLPDGLLDAVRAIQARQAEGGPTVTVADVRRHCDRMLAGWTAVASTPDAFAKELCDGAPPPAALPGSLANRAEGAIGALQAVRLQLTGEGHPELPPPTTGVVLRETCERAIDRRIRDGWIGIAALRDEGEDALVALAEGMVAELQELRRELLGAELDRDADDAPPVTSRITG